MADEAEEAANEDAAAGAEGADGDEEGGGKKKGLPPLILFGGLGAVVLLLAGGAAFLFLGGGDKQPPAAEGEHGEVHADAGHGDGHGEEHATKGDGHDDGHGGGYDDGHGKGHGDGHGDASHVVFYQLPELIVNIHADGRPTYLKLKLTLELDSQDVVQQIEPAMPRVMDRFQSFLRELRVEDLAGSAGSYRLRLELLRRVNLAVAPAEAKAVLIEEMLIQ